jgi:hypothetical protein
MGKIKVKKPPTGTIPLQSPAPEKGIVFSFKYFEDVVPFSHRLGSESYIAAFLQRLQNVSMMPVEDFRRAGNSSLRFHQIDWTQTTRTDGFQNLNRTIREQIVPVQFSVSANDHGRVHGFMNANVFYIIWLDPTHALYA